MSLNPTTDLADVPRWMRDLAEAAGELDQGVFGRIRPREPAAVREAAVLILLGDREHGGQGPLGEPDVLLLRRADGLGSHPGQVAFPGGAADDGDDGPVATALREAVEETGVHPDGVRPVCLLPRIHVPVSGFTVTPVLAYWASPTPVHAVDPGETAAVARVPLRYLADPANRFQVRHPSGFTGPAFAVPGMLVWGLTAALLAMVISIGGWERPWDSTDVRDLDAARRSTEVQPGTKGMSS